MRGTPLLVVLGLLFFAGFAVQRARSPFLRIEREVEFAHDIGTRTGLVVEDVMALRELCGAELERERLLELATTFVANRQRLGEELAALCAVGLDDLADELERAAAGDRVRVHELLRRRPEAVHAVRFAAARDRFAARSAQSAGK